MSIYLYIYCNIKYFYKISFEEKNKIKDIFLNCRIKDISFILLSGCK